MSNDDKVNHTLGQLPAMINSRLDKMDMYSEKSQQMRISAGELLYEAKNKVLEKKAGGEEITWKGWVEQNIKRSYTDCNKCIRLITSGDPDAALEEERRKAREGMAKNRQNDDAVAPPGGTDVDPTEGLDSGDEPENTEPETDQTLDPEPENTEPDMVEEVTDILKEKSLEDLRLQVAYWASNVATVEDLRDVVVYMAIPEVPEGLDLVTTVGGEVMIEKDQKAKAKDAAEKVIKKNNKSKKTEKDEDDRSAAEKLKAANEKVKQALAEESEEKKSKTPTIDESLKEEDDDYVRPGLEGVDLDDDAQDDLANIPDFLKRG